MLTSISRCAVACSCVVVALLLSGSIQKGVPERCVPPAQSVPDSHSTESNIVQQKIALPKKATKASIDLQEESRFLLIGSAMNAFNQVPPGATYYLRENPNDPSVALLVIYAPAGKEKDWPNLPMIVEIGGFEAIEFSSPPPLPSSQPLLAKTNHTALE